jgi:hypothetical protein
MSKHAPVAFRRELDELFDRRTAWLRASVTGPRPGRPLSLNRRHVRDSIGRLQEIASDALADRLARKEFQASVRGRHSWHPKRGKGHGRYQKRQAFKTWFADRFGSGTYIYVFWARRKCVYVGKTTKSGSRIAGHFEKHWFSNVTRIDVYRANGRGALPALECLAIHRFQPSRNRFRAERKKWTRRCALCRVHRDIKDELGKIFRLRLDRFKATRRLPAPSSRVGRPSGATALGYAGGYP